MRALKSLRWRARERIGNWMVAALGLLVVLLLAPAAAQSPTGVIPRLGVIHHGGVLTEVVEGLRAGLAEQGLLEGRHVVLDIRETGGDLQLVEVAARELERSGVRAIYTATTSVTIATMRATRAVPIVFYVGTDPVEVGLISAHAKPNGRATGVHTRTADLTGKRLEILREIIPGLRRVIVFYDPANAVAQVSAKAARDAARRFGLAVDEHTVASVAALRSEVDTLSTKPGDAFLYIADAMVLSQAQFIVEAARQKRLPTMFQDGGVVARGALASYGTSLRELSRASARLVARVLAGVDPGVIPVESFDRVQLHLNMQTAQEIGVKINSATLSRAEIIVR